MRVKMGQPQHHVRQCGPTAVLGSPKRQGSRELLPSWGPQRRRWGQGATLPLPLIRIGHIYITSAVLGPQRAETSKMSAQTRPFGVPLNGSPEWGSKN